MSIVLIALAASVATLVGGAFELRFRDKLHLILGFSAGAVAGVALFDLLPEAIGLGAKYHSAATLALFVALGFFGYLILDRLILLHTHEEDPSTMLGAGETNVPRGFFGALTLSAHSFFDGMAIGVGFQVSTIVGIAAYLIPSVTITPVAALIAAVVLGALNLFIRPILLVLTLPINILTLGLFSLVINAFLVLLASFVVRGFNVPDFWTALLFALVLVVINWVFHFWSRD